MASLWCGLAAFGSVVISQNAAGDLQLSPFTSKLCNGCSILCVMLAVYVNSRCEYHDTRPAVTKEEDPMMQFFLEVTGLLAMAGLFYEITLAVSIKIMGLETLYRHDLLFRRRLRLNRKMLLIFALSTTSYLLMAADCQVVHKGWLAEHHGGHQIVFSIRFWEWVLCAPLTISVSGHLEHTPSGKPRNALMPSAMLSGLYCIIGWQGSIVKDVFIGWALVLFAIFCYGVASAEQLAFAWYIKDFGRAGPLRAGLLFYEVIFKGIYGIFFVLPILGWISATMENKLYCIGDTTFKLGTSIMLVASNDLAANEELRKSAQATTEELLRLISSASVPIFGVNAGCRVDQWNEKVAELTGLPEDHALGKPLVDLLGQEVHEQEDSVREVQQALEGKETNHVETTLRAPSAGGGVGTEGKKARLVLSSTPRKDRKGSVKGVTMIGCDLTEVRAFAEAESRKTRFMATVSHELRSPLHAISGLADMLCDQEEDEGRLRLMRMVKDCASRLLDLVVNIMEMCSMVSSGSKVMQKKLRRQPVDLAKIVEDIMTLVRSAKDKSNRPVVKPGVTLVNELKSPLTVEADAHLCTQVFNNLVTNALKFTQQGKVVVTSRIDPAEEWVEVMVTDTGKGIAQSALKRIFLPFEQEDNSDVRHCDGIGLGLSIAHEAVQLHGGRISVASEVGVGTTFTVCLPVHIPAPGVEAEPKPIRKRRSSVWTRPLVLCVDDDAAHQVIVRDALKADFEVRLVADGEAALAFLRSCEMLPGVVLMDLKMPGRSGIDVCKTVRQEMGLIPTQLPIIMLSAVTSAAVEALDNGCNDFISKPFEAEVLKARVRCAVQMVRLREEELGNARNESQPPPTVADAQR